MFNVFLQSVKTIYTENTSQLGVNQKKQRWLKVDFRSNIYIFICTSKPRSTTESMPLLKISTTELGYISYIIVNELFLKMLNTCRRFESR